MKLNIINFLCCININDINSGHRRTGKKIIFLFLINLLKGENNRSSDYNRNADGFSIG